MTNITLADVVGADIKLLLQRFSTVLFQAGQSVRFYSAIVADVHNHSLLVY